MWTVRGGLIGAQCPGAGGRTGGRAELAQGLCADPKAPERQHAEGTLNPGQQNGSSVCNSERQEPAGESSRNAIKTKWPEPED